MPQIENIILPDIDFKDINSGWGKNFVRLDTDSVWKKMTPQSKSSILSQNTVRLALEHFSNHMKQSHFVLHNLIELKTMPNGSQYVKASGALEQRIQKFYMDTQSETRQGSYQNLELHKREARRRGNPINLIPIPRESPASYPRWKTKVDSKLTRHRSLARNMASQHNVEEVWMMYGISVALRIIERLLCHGYVIVIPEIGRFFVRNVTKNFPRSRFYCDVRIAFQARKDYGFSYKKPTKEV